MRHLIATALLFVSAYAAQAQHNAADMRNGNDLQEMCARPASGTISEPNLFCSGYIRGIADVTQDEGFIDIRTATNGKLMDVVRKYLADHPEHLKGSASNLVVMALMDVFPAKN
jgi:hypothetical protein